MSHETVEVVREWSALSAAVASGALFLFLAVRGPRNVFAQLLTGVVACAFAWNVLEWFWVRSRSTVAYRLMAVGLTFLPAFYFHLALQLAARARTGWLVLAYGSAAVLAALALLDFAYYDRGGWNTLYIALFSPFLAVAVALLARRTLRARAGSRGIFAFPLAAGLLVTPPGLLDLAGVELGAAFSGSATAVASLVLAWGILHYRVVFDSIEVLRESTARALDALNRGLVTFDPGGAAVFCTDTAATLLGMRPERLEDLPRDLRDVVRSGGPRYVKRGARILRVSASRTEGPLRRATPAHLLVEDSTHEYQLLHELAQRESLASLGEAAATLAHEIRNPLSAIRSTVDALPRDGPPGTGQIDRLSGEVRRLSDLVERSLHLARPVEVRPEECDLDALLRRIAERAPPPPRVQLRLAGDLPRVSADPDLLGQVFENLLRNAREAGAAEVEISTARNGNAVVASVKNPGPPIGPEVLGRLFQPFVTTKASGAGVGLALCRKIVTAHGGEIGAYNVEGGVVFEVRLPWTS